MDYQLYTSKTAGTKGQPVWFNSPEKSMQHKLSKHSILAKVEMHKNTQCTSA